MGGPRWTPEEDRVVDWHWGEERFAVTAARVGRSVPSIPTRLIARGESSAGVRGRKTIQAVADETGYDWQQVHRAMRGAGVRAIRTSDTPRARRHLLNEEQVETVIAYLGQETAEHLAHARSVGSCAQEARRSLRTAYAWVVRLELPLLPARRGLLIPDATLLVCTLRAAPSMPPAGSPMTIRAIAEAGGVHRSRVYVLAMRLGLTAGAGARLSPEDADTLRKRLDVARQYHLARSLGLITGRDAKLSPADAEVLGSRLEVAMLAEALRNLISAIHKSRTAHELDRACDAAILVLDQHGEAGQFESVAQRLKESP